MKDMTPRAGDKAIIIYSPDVPSITGMVVDVVSDPDYFDLMTVYFCSSERVLHNQIESPEVRAKVQEIYPLPVPEMYISTNCLLKIIPDKEAKKQFAEKFLDFTKPTITKSIISTK